MLSDGRRECRAIRLKIRLNFFLFGFSEDSSRHCRARKKSILVLNDFSRHNEFSCVKENKLSAQNSPKFHLSSEKTRKKVSSFFSFHFISSNLPGEQFFKLNFVNKIRSVLAKTRNIEWTLNTFDKAMMIESDEILHGIMITCFITCENMIRFMSSISIKREKPADVVKISVLSPSNVQWNFDDILHVINIRLVRTEMLNLALKLNDHDIVHEMRCCLTRVN